LKTQGLTPTRPFSCAVVSRRIMPPSPGMTGLGEVPKPLLESNPRIWHSNLSSFSVRFCTLQNLRSFVFSNFLALFPLFCVFLEPLPLSSSEPLRVPGEKSVSSARCPGRAGVSSRGQRPRKRRVGRRMTLKGSYELRFRHSRSRRRFIRPLQGRSRARPDSGGVAPGYCMNPLQGF